MTLWNLLRLGFTWARSSLCCKRRWALPQTDTVSFLSVNGDTSVDLKATGGQSTMQSSESDPCTTNLSNFRASMSDFEPLQHGHFTVLKAVGSGINGDVLKCSWHRDTSAPRCVAVKKLHNCRLQQWIGAETNERLIHLNQSMLRSEDSLSEIGILRHLCQQTDFPPYLVRMLGVYTDNHFTWLVSEFADGGDLFELVATQHLGEARVQRFIWQLLQAVAYLHEHNIGHRDVSLENILLQAGVAKLVDFGMAVQACSTSGAPLRYFRSVGKDNSRAPEVYVPREARVKVAAPPMLAPDRVAMVEVQGQHLCEVRFPEAAQPGQYYMADVWGYRATPADVFSSGICLFMMACESPPWQRARLTDPRFSFVYRRGVTGILDLMQDWGHHLGAQPATLLSEMVKIDPSQRPSARDCLSNNWFAAMGSEELTCTTIECRR
eukprot:CAMPEP_0172669242 /NCGR_PEP_ID=MMETSP1074-20121228/9553_1 /TAXON_ID=2916 /ORGANISM="Ceratium fusus, Strain PA161109" /LENGTH=435 /DNA_ID=CAMNT_0013485991 /DNA_START=33 /DNA_END=1340 /DNA_ORIENTATION=+